jgi:predicted MFS family arabinose efflux permease
MSEKLGANLSISEGKILAVLAAVQVVNVLDFMMVMPMGPEFSTALHIPSSALGSISASYTGAACISGLISSTFLERFDRRSALLVALLGLVIGTFAGAAAVGFHSLLLARVVAGAFGGPATAVTLAILADIVPPERRGRATGKLMGAFAFASVIGVPAGLFVAQRFGWRAPFIGVAALGAGVAAVAHAALPALRLHLDAATKRTAPAASRLAMFSKSVILALLLTFCTMAASFTLIPNIASYLQFNLHIARCDLGGFYLAGGCVSLATTQLAGRLVDRFGAVLIGSIGSVFVCGAVYAGFATNPPLLVPIGFFMAFMFSTGMRNVGFMVLTSQVPQAHERARYQSVQNAASHAASSTGAFVASQLLSERSDKSLVGMPHVVWLSMVLSLIVVPLLYFVGRQVAGLTRATPKSDPAVR